MYYIFFKCLRYRNPVSPFVATVYLLEGSDRGEFSWFGRPARACCCPWRRVLERYRSFYAFLNIAVVAVR